MAVVLAVALGGSLGALARYGMMIFVERRSLSVFPWDVFVVNMTGCFAVGLLISALVDRHDTPEWLRIGLVLGFIGAYTTFSTFAQDLYDLGEAKEYALAALNLIASVGAESRLSSRESGCDERFDADPVDVDFRFERFEGVTPEAYASDHCPVFVRVP
jgi:CrcB protein